MYPGANAVTQTPLLIHSLLRAFVSCPTAPLELAYAATPYEPLKVSIDATLIIFLADGNGPNTNDVLKPVPCQRSGKLEASGQIHLEYLIPSFVWKIHGRRATREPSTVDQDIDLPSVIDADPFDDVNEIYSLRKVAFVHGAITAESFHC